MRNLLMKVKRVDPIIDIKRKKLDQEVAALAAIRLEKQQIVASMKDSQRRYMEGFQNLNRIRSSSDRFNIATLESALDTVKAQWQKLRLEVERIEIREKAQISHLLTAERDLRAVETLKDRYQAEFNHAMRKQDQKLLDEHAILRHIERKT